MVSRQVFLILGSLLIGGIEIAHSSSHPGPRLVVEDVDGHEVSLPPLPPLNRVSLRPPTPIPDYRGPQIIIHSIPEEDTSGSIREAEDRVRIIDFIGNLHETHFREILFKLLIPMGAVNWIDFLSDGTPCPPGTLILNPRTAGVLAGFGANIFLDIFSTATTYFSFGRTLQQLPYLTPHRDLISEYPNPANFSQADVQDALFSLQLSSFGVNLFTTLILGGVLSSTFAVHETCPDSGQYQQFDPTAILTGSIIAFFTNRLGTSTMTHHFYNFYKRLFNFSPSRPPASTRIGAFFRRHLAPSPLPPQDENV